MWQKVAKFKGAEYFRKALYISKSTLSLTQYQAREGRREREVEPEESVCLRP